jgi:hypothetical protein
MSQEFEAPIAPPDPDHVHDWFDAGATGEVDADGNDIYLWICYVGGCRTHDDPT